MRILDSRRLTGASLFLDRPGAVLDIAVDEDSRDLLVEAWKKNARRLFSELEWPDEILNCRPMDDGVSLALSGPADGLYTATEVNEAAFEAARDWMEGSQRHLLQRVARALREEYRDEERPRLQRLLREAKRESVPVLLDEDEVTLGMGQHSQTWDLYEVPHPDDVQWRRLKAIPTALVTGTNGKTTTTRLLASIARAAGKVAGVSSTDWLAMGDELLDRDDYAGPGGARIVLRDKRCELAILETARGGLLRRGLAVDHADVALITNIAADHLGDFGVHTMEDLADVKWSVTRALHGKATLVLNAEDPLLMSRAARWEKALVLFSLSPRCASYRQHIKAGGIGYTVRGGRIERQQGDDRATVVAVKKIPLTYDGAAKHNVANALAAAAVADSLGLAKSAIKKGLVALSNEDNPGRANLFEVNGVSVLLDFAHNPAGFEALAPMINTLAVKRRVLITGQAGDRSDADIREFAEVSAAVKFDRVIIKRMDGHARGRALGEVARLMKESFEAQGFSPRQLSEKKTELDAVRAALRWSKAGDLIVLLSHEQRDKTYEYIRQRAS
ncbi:MAG: Mur ligase family protein [Pseudomonadota bacterium]